MGDLGNIQDARPFGRDQVFGWQTAKKIFDGIFELISVLRAYHSDDGDFNDRQVTKIRGNYLWNGATKYILKGQTGAALLPTEITPTGTGDLTITFTSPLPEATYDIHVTGGIDSDNRPGQIGVRYGTKAAATVRVLMTKNSSTTAENLDGFSVSISYDGA